MTEMISIAGMALASMGSIVLCGYVVRRFMAQNQRLVELTLVKEVKEREMLERMRQRDIDKRARKNAIEQKVPDSYYDEEGLL